MTGTLLTLALCIGLAAWTRYQRPLAMLTIWGDTKLSGWSIDTLLDVQSLRVDLQIDGIAPIPVPEANHPNIVLLTVDTLRADRTPIYGGKADMPTLRSLAKRGIVVERAFSPGNVTRRSLPTLATGLSPWRVRGRVAGWALRLDPRHVLLAERFRAAGYDTAGFFCCRSHFGRSHKLGLVRGIDTLELDYDGADISASANAFLKKRGKTDKPLFLWAHYIEPHNWLQDHKSKEGARRRVDRYDLSIEATDRYLGDIIKGIDEALGDNTIIIVTSDHGEGLGDHGSPHHSKTLYNSEIRIPLVFVGPGIGRGRLKQAVGLVDIAPTLLELAGFQAPGMPTMDGLSVAKALGPDTDDKIGVGEAYSMMVPDRSVQQKQYAIMSGRYKLIERSGSTYELFDILSDPQEKKDLKDRVPEILWSMKARLERRKRIDKVPPF